MFHYIPEFFRFVRHTPELFRLWRVARIAHASAEAMALATAKDQEEQRQLLAKLTQASTRDIVLMLTKRWRCCCPCFPLPLPMAP